MKTFLLGAIAILILPFLSQAQFVTVSGYISNFNTREAIENVTVLETISGIGTISGKDGYYKLILVTGQINVSFSQVGFSPSATQLELKSDTVLMVKLEPLITNKNKGKMEGDQGDTNFKGKVASVKHKLPWF